jgi:hypothetical protein
MFFCHVLPHLQVDRSDQFGNFFYSTRNASIRVPFFGSKEIHKILSSQNLAIFRVPTFQISHFLCHIWAMVHFGHIIAAYTPHNMRTPYKFVEGNFLTRVSVFEIQAKLHAKFGEFWPNWWIPAYNVF